MVGFEDVLTKILDKLIGPHSSSREILPIVGMGGIGKTTLALNAYEKDCIVEHFDIRCWVTISQKYNSRDILLEISGLDQRNNKDVEDHLSHMSKTQSGEMIHKNFFGRRYLIVMDDMWSTEVWDEVKRFFRDNNNGSRIIVTTRIDNVVLKLTNSSGVQLKLLNETKSWNLLCKTAFGEDPCPSELEEIGNIIAKNCKGLPLSIVVIGGLLAKSNRTKAYWEYIGKNISSIANLEDDDRCFKILYTSYRQLPVHLRSCFLYMGVYPEDAEIKISWLIKLLVAEGFLKKPNGSNTMEKVAREFIEELVYRNLILLHVRGTNGNIKKCKIHDMLRDLFIREAQKERFLYVFSERNFDPQEGIKTQRRIAVHRTTDKYPLELIDTLQSSLHARSIFIKDLLGESWHFNSRMLRILKATDDFIPNDDDKIIVGSKRGISQLYNLRYLAIDNFHDLGLGFGSSLSMFWNLQTIIVLHSVNYDVICPIDIWKLPQVRHVKVYLLQIPSPLGNDFVLWNLNNLSRVREFTWYDEVVKRIPNIRELEIAYDYSEDYSAYHLDNIQHLDKLEHLRCEFLPTFDPMSNLLQHLVFPWSLKLCL